MTNRYGGEHFHLVGILLALRFLRIRSGKGFLHFVKCQHIRLNHAPSGIPFHRSKVQCRKSVALASGGIQNAQ